MTVLIVNADDFGCAVSATDAILTCHREGAITSATAMVYMEDSDRAARLAVDQRLPVGLRINLTTPFTDRSVPYAVRERQARMVDVLGRSRAYRWLYDVRLQAEVDRSLRDQLDRFGELYARPPTHFDSHHHVHSCPNVFLSRVLSSGAPIRNTLIWSPRRGRLILEARRARQRLLERRLHSPAAIVCLDVLLKQHGPSPARVARRSAATSSACSFPASSPRHCSKSHSASPALVIHPLHSISSSGSSTAGLRRKRGQTRFPDPRSTRRFYAPLRADRSESDRGSIFKQPDAALQRVGIFSKPRAGRKVLEQFRIPAAKYHVIRLERCFEFLDHVKHVSRPALPAGR